MTSQFKIKVGMNIQEYRKRAEMTQKELADKLGLSEGNISKYEAGDIKRVDIEMVMQIASALSCDPNDITGWKDEDSSIQYNIDEIDLIEKYRYISKYSPEGAEAVNFTLNREYKIAEQIHNIGMQPEMLSYSRDSLEIKAAHTDHESDPDEQQRMRTDLSNLKRPN